MNYRIILDSFRESIDRYDDAWIPLINEVLENISCLSTLNPSADIKQEITIHSKQYAPLTETFISEFFLSLWSYPPTLRPRHSLSEYCRVRENSPEKQKIENMYAFFLTSLQTNIHSILNILKARQTTVLGIAEIKMFLQSAPLDKERWNTVRQKYITKAGNYNIDVSFLDNLFEMLHKESLHFQEIKQNAGKNSI